MNNTNWIKGDFDNYFSNHITEKYLGDNYPKYHVLENPEGEGYVIGQFYPFIGEYVPLEEEGEARLIFESAEAAKNHVDNNLGGSKND